MPDTQVQASPAAETGAGSPRGEPGQARQRDPFRPLSGTTGHCTRRLGLQIMRWCAAANNTVRLLGQPPTSWIAASPSYSGQLHLNRTCPIWLLKVTSKFTRSRVNTSYLRTFARPLYSCRVNQTPGAVHMRPLVAED